jgi:tetratricopeptide (TPR) repeat protein
MKANAPSSPGSNKPNKSRKTAGSSDAAEKSAAPPAKVVPGPVPPLFRRIDWWTLGIAFGIVWVIYFLCLAPEVTLEDSGELSTASYYAGIPHPPGYPFWTIYTWLWTVLVPLGNVNWRVELGESTAAAMGCGLVAFMVSRGSSMLMEGIEELKGMTGKWENAICLVCGVTAGLLMALGSMWKESVVINRISLFGVPWMMIVLLCMMRWIYAPHQRGYLYCAMFFLGICTTIHQTLMVAIMGIQIGIAATQPKLGRDLFLVNSIFYLGGLMARSAHMIPGFEAVNPMVFAIYNFVGIGSLIAAVWLVIKTQGLFTEWKALLLLILLGFLGASFYFYEALSGMTNPPMEWGYPRTVEGFWHALSRGQYGKIDPTDVFHDPKRFGYQLIALVMGLADGFNWVCIFFALLPIFFMRKMKKRERCWILTIAAIYPFLGVLLTIFLNPSRERQMSDLVKVFYSSSHSIFAILIGYGLALTAAYMAAQYQKFRRWGLMAGVGLTLFLALYWLRDVTAKHYFGLAGEISFSDLPHWIGQAFAKDQYGSPIFAALLLVFLSIIFVAALAVYRERAPLLILLGLFILMPVASGLAHWFHSEEHHHWFGYWYGHDMFTPPFKAADGSLAYDSKQREQKLHGPDGKFVYPEMDRDAILFGGTDPGRFCPTYMIFCESFIPHSDQPKMDQEFDRRDVYIITQNALADPTYLDYIRAQYFRSAQHDPPFFQNFLPVALPSVFHGPTTWLAWLDDIFTSLGARVEKARRTGTSWFKAQDFTNVRGLADKLRSGPQQDALSRFLEGQLAPRTKALVDGKGDERELARALAEDFNTVLKSGSIYESNRFGNLKLPPLIQKAEQTSQLPNTDIRLNRRLLEEAYPNLIAKSLGGVYPDTEIYTPSFEDYKMNSDGYFEDVARRLQHDQRFPNEPKQMQPGEDVRVDQGGRLQVFGQVPVMKINGLLTKVIFDHNPEHEFYVEESMPLDWMFPHLLPYGIIMKINKHPMAQLPDDDLQRDHRFWSDYCARNIGDWITYDTSIKEICDFAEKVYLRHNYSGFKGDLKFVRDEDGQKTFSKLRGAIGASIYLWRSEPRHNANAEDVKRMSKEAEFALKQSFAFCPFNEETVMHLLQLLLPARRYEEALQVVETCRSLDPYNQRMNDWVEQLKQAVSPRQPSVAEVLNDIRQAMASHDTNRADQLLQYVMRNASPDSGLFREVAQFYIQLGAPARAQEAVEKLTKVDPGSSANWYNLARLQAFQGNAKGASDSLKRAFAINDVELKKGPGVTNNLRVFVTGDPYFDPIRKTPEYEGAVK